jgi:hypothetical protein
LVPADVKHENGFFVIAATASEVEGLICSNPTLWCVEKKTIESLHKLDQAEREKER